MGSSLEPLVRGWRKRPLWEPGPGTQRIQHDRAAVQRILPHRDPFLFVDAITAVDLEAGCVRGQRRIDPADPVFAGHFPGEPVYPGVLQLETMGQLGLCLVHFQATGSAAIAADATPQRVRALKIHDALFAQEVLPGDELTVLARLVEADDWVAVCAGQLLKGDAVCSVGVMEVYFVEG